MKRIPRRIFTEEFKREAIKLVTEHAGSQLRVDAQILARRPGSSATESNRNAPPVHRANRDRGYLTHALRSSSAVQTSKPLLCSCCAIVCPMLPGLITPIFLSVIADYATLVLRQQRLFSQPAPSHRG